MMEVVLTSNEIKMRGTGIGVGSVGEACNGEEAIHYLCATVWKRKEG